MSRAELVEEAARRLNLPPSVARELADEELYQLGVCAPSWSYEKPTPTVEDDDEKVLAYLERTGKEMAPLELAIAVNTKTDKVRASLQRLVEAGDVCKVEGVTSRSTLYTATRKDER